LRAGDDGRPRQQSINDVTAKTNVVRGIFGVRAEALAA
jgi:hypothetical protein